MTSAWVALPTVTVSFVDAVWPFAPCHRALILTEPVADGVQVVPVRP